MSSRELVYRINLSTSDAKRQARNVRATFEAELRTIQVGKLDVSQIQSAVSQAQRLRIEFEQAAVAANRVSQNASNIRPQAPAPSSPAPSVSSGIGGAIAGGVAGYLTVQGLQLVSNYVVESAKLDTQIRRTEAAFEFLAGGAAKAEARILAVQDASNGTIARMDAMSSVNQIAALGLANTTQEFEELAKAARIVSTYSSQIKDFNDALAQLGLFSASSSFARADQLLINASDLKERVAALKAEDASLTDQQAKLKASVQLLNSEFGPLLETTAAQASGAEELAVAWGEFINQKSGISATFNAILGGMADVVDELSVISGFGNSRSILEVTKANAEVAASSAESFLAPAGAERNAKAFDFTAKLLEKLNQGVKDGIPTALEYRSQVEAIAVAADRFGVVTENQARALLEIDSAYKSAAVSAKVYSNADELARQNREKMVFEQQAPIESAIASRAAKAVPTAGLEQTIALYRQQKAAVDAAIQQLIDSGVSDQNELAIRVADITRQLLQPFDELEARASEIDLMSALGNFTDVGTALSGLNAGFVDFLPGLSAARDELITLSNEMALTGQLSDEQAARLEYLSAVAYSVADGGSALNAVVAELGGSFLESNAYAAELVNQLFMAEAAYAQGAITGDIYAGIMATLTGQLLTVAQGAGIATGAIMQLNAAQSGMASIGGLAIGGSIANRVQTQQQAAGREQNRREQERYNKDLARSQERSASRAGKLLEDGAKKANQELKSALDKVPGLFGATQVTEQDMKDAQLGVYQEKADEYLRRLRDEVQNGNDWEDVSIEEARAGLERAGLQIGETAEQTLMFLERAINDSSLYSAVENIPIFINEEAVKYTQELQNKSEEGRKNIYEYFGIQVDEAVGAATGGGGGAIEVKPPEFVDIDPLTEGLQTGLDEYVATTGAVIKEQVATAKALFFDPVNLFGATGAKSGAMGPAAKPEITVTADPAATALMPVITGQVQPTVNVQFAGAQTGAQAAAAPATMTITPTLDLTGIQAQLDALTPTITATLGLDAENLLNTNGLISALTPGIMPNLTITVGALSDFTVYLQDNIPTPGVETALAVTVEEIGLFKDLVEGIVKPTVQTELSVTSEAMAAFATYLETNIPTPGIEAHLTATVGAMSDFTVYLQDNVPTPGIQTALAVTIEEIQLFEKLVSGLVHPTVTVALATPPQQTNDDGSQGANAITPLITGINTQIRSSQEEIKNQGITIAMILMAGIAAHFQGGQTTGGEQASTPLADALMTNVSTQFTAAQGMFYAVGFLPAQSVESGFKGYGYTGLSSGLLDALTTGIRADADSYMQRGATIAGYVQAGMNQQFSAETGVRSAIAAGAAWGNAFMRGVFDALNGAGFVDQITTNVIDGITGELEQP